MGTNRTETQADEFALDVEAVAIELMMSIGCPRRLWDGVSEEIRDCYRGEAARLLAGIEQMPCG